MANDAAEEAYLEWLENHPEQSDTTIEEWSGNGD